MPSFTPELKRILKAAGCYLVRQGRGDHEIWFSPISQRNFTLDGSIKSRHTANETLKQAGLPKSLLTTIHLQFSKVALKLAA